MATDREEGGVMSFGPEDPSLQEGDREFRKAQRFFRLVLGASAIVFLLGTIMVIQACWVDWQGALGAPFFP